MFDILSTDNLMSTALKITQHNIKFNSKKKQTVAKYNPIYKIKN